MKHLLPHKFRDGDTLPPESINADMREIERLRDDLVDLRYFTSSFVMRFDDYDQADTEAERQRKIPMPSGVADMEIIGVELFVYGTSGEDFTLTCDATGFETVTATGAGATTLGFTQSNQNAVISANATTTFTFDSAATTWAVTNAWAVIHTRADRFAGSPPANFSPVRIKASDTDNPSAINTALTNWGTDVTASGNATDHLRLEVILLDRNDSADTDDDTFRLPASGRHLAYASIGAVGVTNSYEVEVNSANGSPGGGDVALLTAVVTGTSNHIVASAACDDTQPNDVDDTADDYVLQFASRPTTRTLCYAVLLWRDT